MKYLAPCLAFILLSTPAMAQSVGEKTGVNSTLGIAPRTEDFVKQAAISDMFEIETSKIAEQRGNADQKAFAGTMIKDHETTSADLMALAGAWKTALPNQLDSTHRSKIDQLKSLKGPEFSSRYNLDQVSGHKDAVSLFERYAKGGDDPKLKEWAEKTLPTLRHHLVMAQEMAAGKTIGRH
jgi:putative membrane protein